VLDPQSLEPAKEGDIGHPVVTGALRTNNVTPFLLWLARRRSSRYNEADDAASVATGLHCASSSSRTNRKRKKHQNKQKKQINQHKKKKEKKPTSKKEGE